MNATAEVDRAFQRFADGRLSLFELWLIVRCAIRDEYAPVKGSQDHHEQWLEWRKL